MPKQIHHYDPNTFEYIGTSVPDIDPLDGTPMIPAFATLAALPTSIPKNKVAIFDVANDLWSTTDDHRGTVYDTATGQSETWDKLASLPAGKTPLAPTDPANESWDAASSTWKIDIAKVKSAKIAQVKDDYQAALDAGVTYSGALFQSDAKSISTLTETMTAISNGWPLPTAFTWIDSANKSHPANLAFLKGLSVAMANHKSALFSRLYAAKSKINSAKTPAAVKAVAL